MRMVPPALLFAALALAGAALALAGAARAQDAPPTGGRAIGAIFDGLGLRKPPAPAPDFVRESRPERLDYLPLAPRPGTSQKKTPAEMEALGAQLDRAIAENKRKAARVKTPY